MGKVAFFCSCYIEIRFILCHTANKAVCPRWAKTSQDLGLNIKSEELNVIYLFHFRLNRTYSDASVY